MIIGVGDKDRLAVGRHTLRAVERRRGTIAIIKPFGATANAAEPKLRTLVMGVLAKEPRS